MKLSNLQFTNLINLTITSANNTLIYYQQKINIDLKSYQSPLTIADITTNDIIVQGLQQITPDIPIISEENSLVDYQIRQKYTYYWLIDPLDGTKEFINGGRDYTVNIGLIYKNKPIFGLVASPVEQHLYFGWTTDHIVIDAYLLDKPLVNGAYLYDYGNQQLTQIECRPTSNYYLKIVASKSHYNKETTDFLQHFPNSELVNIGSSLKILHVASNKADLYPRLGLTSEWDTAAAHAILLASGGVMYRLDCNKLSQFVYNKENILNSFFICGHPKILDKIDWLINTNFN